MDQINIKKEVEKAFKAATMATVVTFKSDMAVLTAEVAAEVLAGAAAEAAEVKAKSFKNAEDMME